MNAVRPAAVAGMFYPSDPETLRRDVDDMLSAVVSSKSASAPRALIVPHAGYRYSGPTAAHAYALLKDLSFDSVILVGPSHREFFHGISVYPGSGFRTPLGTVPIDGEIREELFRLSPDIRSIESGHRSEHCLEVQLPFLQRVLGDFSIVPMIMGDQDPRYVRALGDALANVLASQNVLLVASSDLSHYHDAATADTLDAIVVGLIRRIDPDGLQEQLESGRVEACGGGPIVAVMQAAKRAGATEAKVLHRCNSGDVTGERDQVVGYVSAVFRKPG